LYDKVWAGEVNPDNSSNAVQVLKKLGHGTMFNKGTSADPTDKTYALYYDLAELLRKSLRDCIVVLRGSKER
jgi:hypothetical protein